jgi:hypothetical protein
MPDPCHHARLALELAALGWHILPLAPGSKRPLGNCSRCRPQRGQPTHPASDCPCLAAGRWCHGVRAATTDPARITTWWQHEPRAIPGIAAGPSNLVLVDIDAHGSAYPPHLATGLLPGIDLAAEPIPPPLWSNPAKLRDGRDTLTLLARIRGGPRPWPSEAEYQPVTVVTPSGGAHLWYRAQVKGHRQVLSDPQGRNGLAWQVDIKAGWSYGIAPGSVTARGAYRIRNGDLAQPGRMPDWLAREIARVTAKASPRPDPPAAPPAGNQRGPAAYLATVIVRGAAQLAAMTDGRQRSLSALAFQIGGLLHWADANPGQLTSQLIDAGTASGLSTVQATRIVTRALANGIAQPLNPPGHRG